MVPVLLAGQVGAREIMLDIKEPYPDGASHERGGHLDQKVRLDSYSDTMPSRRWRRWRDREIDAELAFQLVVEMGEPEFDEKLIEEAQPEHDEGIPVQPVRHALGQRRPEVFFHGHDGYRTRAAPVKVAAGDMMDGMIMPPLLIGREGQDAAHVRQDGIGSRVPEKGAVAAIMEKNEDADVKGDPEDRQRRKSPSRRRP